MHGNKRVFFFNESFNGYTTHMHIHWNMIYHLSVKSCPVKIGFIRWGVKKKKSIGKVFIAC
jgi:hypothetical protein